MYKLFVLRSTKTGLVCTIGITRSELKVKLKKLLQQDQQFDCLFYLSRGLKLQGHTLTIELVEELPGRKQAEHRMHEMIRDYQSKGHLLTNTDIDRNKLSKN